MNEKLNVFFPALFLTSAMKLNFIYVIYASDNFLQSHLYSEYLTLNENKYYEITSGESFWSHIRHTSLYVTKDPYKTL